MGDGDALEYPACAEGFFMCLAIVTTAMVGLLSGRRKIEKTE
jgi:hypothetical protein